jgi:hypothetical protein
LCVLEAPLEGFALFYATEYFCEMLYLYENERRNKLFTVYFQTLVELMVNLSIFLTVFVVDVRWFAASMQRLFFFVCAYRCAISKCHQLDRSVQSSLCEGRLLTRSGREEI